MRLPKSGEKKKNGQYISNEYINALSWNGKCSKRHRWRRDRPNMTKFTDIVKSKTETCAKCFSMVYSLPCIINVKLASFLEHFGKPVYPMDITKVLRIDFGSGFQIEGRIGSKKIKFTMPKKFEKVAADKATERINFEKALVEWMTDALDIEIET